LFQQLKETDIIETIISKEIESKETKQRKERAVGWNTEACLRPLKMLMGMAM